MLDITDILEHYKGVTRNYEEAIDIHCMETYLLPHLEPQEISLVFVPGGSDIEANVLHLFYERNFPASELLVAGCNTNPAFSTKGYTSFIDGPFGDATQDYPWSSVSTLSNPYGLVHIRFPDMWFNKDWYGIAGKAHDYLHPGGILYAMIHSMDAQEYISWTRHVESLGFSSLVNKRTGITRSGQLDQRHIVGVFKK